MRAMSPFLVLATYSLLDLAALRSMDGVIRGLIAMIFLILFFAAFVWSAAGGEAAILPVGERDGDSDLDIDFDD